MEAGPVPYVDHIDRVYVPMSWDVEHPDHVEGIPGMGRERLRRRKRLDADVYHMTSRNPLFLILDNLAHNLVFHPILLFHLSHSSAMASFLDMNHRLSSSRANGICLGDPDAVLMRRRARVRMDVGVGRVVLSEKEQEVDQPCLVVACTTYLIKGDERMLGITRTCSEVGARKCGHSSGINHLNYIPAIIHPSIHLQPSSVSSALF
jgi:hypothetical protein